MEFYEPHLARVEDAEMVMEYGVYRGDSIKYLSERFAHARIIGCDIVTPRDDWPRSPRIEYVTLDQGDNAALAQLFRSYPKPFDLVIEDGSHKPVHQKNCLLATLPHIRPGGVYVLEDLHTSHPAHPSMGNADRMRTNSYHMLLTFEHILTSGLSLTDDCVHSLALRSLFGPDEIRRVFLRIGTIDVYRRALLPLRCYRCGSNDFAYDQLRCRCGTNLVDAVDSISAVITVKAADPVHP
jgi:predicted O-methyltransferase YrrM